MSILTRLASTLTVLSRSDHVSCGSNELDLAAEEVLDMDADRKPGQSRDRLPRACGGASLPPSSRSARGPQASAARPPAVLHVP